MRFMPISPVNFKVVSASDNSQDFPSNLLDEHSFEEWPVDISADNSLFFPTYQKTLANARAKTALTESVRVGRANLQEHPVAVILCDFSFIGGSLGLVAGERIAFGFEQAANLGLPVISVLSSGGARMQEGMIALVQMAKTVVAARTHATAGLLQITICRDPTAGGMYASFGALADVIIAEPEATIGFAGPIVAQTLLNRPLDGSSHTATTLFAAGGADALLNPTAQRAELACLLQALQADPLPLPAQQRPTQQPALTKKQAKPSNWDAVCAARSPTRPSGKEAVAALTTDFFRLRGDRAGGDDASIVAGLGRLHGRPVGIIAQDRKSGAAGQTTPAGFRLARRTALLSERLELPLLTFIDTPGACPNEQAERQGQAAEIAQTFACLLNLATPILSVCIGEGGSGGALALGCGDNFAMQESSVFYVLSPEGAATILQRDATRAPEVAELFRFTPAELLADGIIDEIVPDDFGELSLTIAHHIDELSAIDSPVKNRQYRLDRWRKAGNNHLKT